MTARPELQQLVLLVVSQLVTLVIGFALGRRDRELQLRRGQLRQARADVYGETAESFFVTCTACDALYDRNAIARCPNCAQPAPIIA